MSDIQNTIVMTRGQMYAEAWKMSVAGVARKHSLNYSRLIKKYKEENIPFPSSRYWSRKNLGMDVSDEVVPLEGNPERKVSLITKNVVTKKEKEHTFPEKEKETFEQAGVKENQNHLTQDIPEGILSFLNEDERQLVWEKARSLKIEENTRLHSTIAQYKKRHNNYTLELKKAQEKPYYSPQVHKPADEPEFFKEVSEEGMKRGLAIINALYKAVEQLGGVIHDDLSVTIHYDRVNIRLAEGKDKINHELTKQEAKELVEYNERVKRYSWTSKPRIRKYDYVYNGRLRILFDSDYIRDNASRKLEDCLGDMLIALYNKSEENRIKREKREEEQRKREEERRLEEERRSRKETEVRKTIELENIADDYHTATKIRVLIQAMIDSGSVSEEWAEWARKKADWYDPIISAEDELLGKREHGKNKEEKEKDMLNQINRYRWWY